MATTNNAVPFPNDFLNQILATGNSALLEDLYSQFQKLQQGNASQGHVYIGAANGGTYSQGGNLYIDASWLPNSKSGNSLTVAQMAAVIGHEMAHAVVPGGSLNFSNATNPGAAVQVGVQAEGAAYLFEYVIALQIGQNAVDEIPPSVRKVLQTYFPNASSVTQFSTVQGLLDYSQYSTIRETVGTAAENLSLGKTADSPGTGYKDAGFTYGKKWVDVWILDQVLGLSPSQYNLKAMSASVFSENTIAGANGTVLGWQFSGTEVPLLPGAATQSGPPSVTIVAASKAL